MGDMSQELEERMKQQAEPTAAWARRWNVAPGGLGNHAGVATYSGYAGYVRKGWIPILDRLAEDLIALGWDRTLHQVKQKFGELCFYAGRLPSNTFEAVSHRIEEATAESRRTCEECGAPGRPAPVGGPDGWVETLCPRCFEREDAEVRACRAEEERMAAETETALLADEEEAARKDPKYRKYLEEHVYPLRRGQSDE